MIDPRNITKFDRSQSELEEFAIFSVLVAGKTARTIARSLEKLLSYNKTAATPLEFIEIEMGVYFLPDVLRICGVGCSTAKAETICQLAKINWNNRAFLRQCTTEQMEQIRGIGPKTSRFFIMHSRPHQRMAALDTHILKGLRDYGIPNVPRSRPSSLSSYRRLEQKFLEIADLQEKEPAVLDLEWWTRYAR